MTIKPENSRWDSENPYDEGWETKSKWNLEMPSMSQNNEWESEAEVEGEEEEEDSQEIPEEEEEEPSFE